MNEQIRNAAERFADEHQQEQRELLVGSVRYRVSCRTAGGHSYVDFGSPSAIRLQRGQQGNPLRSFHRVSPPLCLPALYSMAQTGRIGNSPPPCRTQNMPAARSIFERFRRK